MNENKNLFLIRSPLQAFNAIEAKGQFTKGEENIVIIFYRREIDKELILKTLAYSSWTKIIIQKLKPHYQLFKFFRTFLKEEKSFNYCFIGDYSTLINYYMNRLKYDKLFLLEDGAATINQIKRLESKTLHKLKKTKYTKKNILQRNLESVLKIDQKYLYQATFFSIYNIETKFPMIKNDYGFFKKNITSLKEKKCVFFIGSNLSDGILLSKDIFEKYLEEIILKYKNDNMDFYYILHRKEDEKYMSLLSKKLSFKCMKFTNIIELEFLNLKYIPSEISTFISSAITTLKLLYPTKYTFFKIHDIHVNNQFKEIVSEVQKNLNEKEKIIENDVLTN